VRETAEHIHATGDEKTGDLLTSLLESLSPTKDSSYPVVVTKAPS